MLYVQSYTILLGCKTQKSIFVERITENSLIIQIVTRAFFDKTNFVWITIFLSF
jgi:hypothetical protein